MDRREFLSASVSAAALSVAAGAAEAAQEDNSLTTERVIKQSGEPYKLMGKRLVFTSWYYVRPGNIAWVNDRGENVTVSGNEGPFGAHLVHSDQPWGIRLRARQAVRKGPVIKSEKPWEDNNGTNFQCILKEGDRFRAWSATAYYESKDGYHWDRPSLELREHGGSKDNNLIVGNLNGGAVFIDPSCPPEERYKWVGMGELTDDQLKAYQKAHPDRWEPRAIRTDAKLIVSLVGKVSSDGYTWTELPEPMVVEHSDTHIVSYYDDRLRKYVIYTRNYTVGEKAENYQNEGFRMWWDVGRRSIGRTESSDFKRFPLSNLIISPRSEYLPSDLLYTNCHTTIPDASDHHLLFPAVWHTSADDTSVDISASPDGKVWTWVPGGPVLKTGDFGEFDGGCVFPVPNLLALPDGDWVLPYSAYGFPHKYPRGSWNYGTGYAVWPKGRMIGLEAPERGEFATVAFVPNGGKMYINAQIKRGGSIAIEAAALGGAAIPGRAFADAVPLVGDCPRALVRWKEHDNLGIKKDEAVMLRFKMNEAAVFGLEFE